MRILNQSTKKRKDGTTITHPNPWGVTGTVAVRQAVRITVETPLELSK